LPGKHSTSRLARLDWVPKLLTLANAARVARRGWVAAAVLVATAAAVSSVVWVGSSLGAQLGPVLVQPPIPMPVASTSSAPAATSAPVTSSPSTRRTTRHASPVPRRSRVTQEPAAPSRTARPANVALTATYRVRSSWDTGFIGVVQVSNESATPQHWTVAVRYNGADGVRITQAWNGSVSRQGDVMVFSGGPLEPGGTQNLGFEATKQATGEVRPTSCTANGSWCRMS
jgi:cellulase/cellobiase CelA1